MTRWSASRRTLHSGAHRVSELGDIDRLQQKLGVEISDVSSDDRIIVAGNDHEPAVGRTPPKEERELQAVVFADAYVGDNRIRLFMAKVLARFFVGFTHSHGTAVFAERGLQDARDIGVVFEDENLFNGHQATYSKTSANGASTARVRWRLRLVSGNFTLRGRFFTRIYDGLIAFSVLRIDDVDDIQSVEQRLIETTREHLMVKAAT